MKIGDIVNDGIVFQINPDGKSGLMAMKDDLANKYDWSMAIAKGIVLGDGRRLPSKEEPNLLYEQKDIVGGFGSCYYWSSTETGDNYAWSQGFKDGHQYDGCKDYVFRVRVIRAF